MSESTSTGSFWGKLYSQGTNALQSYEKQFEGARKDLLKYAESAKSSQWAKDLSAYAGQATHDLDRLRETLTESARENYDSIRDAAKHEMEKIAEWEKEQERLLAQNAKNADDFVVMADGTIVPIQKETPQDEVAQKDDSNTRSVPETSLAATSVSGAAPLSNNDSQDDDSQEKTPVKSSKTLDRAQSPSNSRDESYSPDLKHEDLLHAAPQGEGDKTPDLASPKAATVKEAPLPGDAEEGKGAKEPEEDHVFLGGLDLSQPPPILSVLKKEWSHLRESNSGKEIQKRLQDLQLNEQAQKIYSQGGSLLDEVNKIASNVVSLQGPQDSSTHRGVLTRQQVMMNKLRRDRERLLQDPAVVISNDEDLREEYAAFLAHIEASGGYASASWQAAIDKQLEDARKESSALDETYGSLVPDEIPDEVFWSRFLFFAEEIDKEENLRRQLLSSAEQAVDEDEFAWDDDDDNDEDGSANATLNPRLEVSDISISAYKTLSPRDATLYAGSTSAVPSVSGESRESYDFVSDVRSDDSDSDWN